MPPQKIIIRSKSLKPGQRLPSPKPELSENQSKLVERLLSKQSNRANCIEDQLQSYYDHVGGQCICSICDCGKHQCNGKFCKNKPQMHGSKSIYQREFVRKSPDMNFNYNQNLFNNPKQKGDVGNVSTYKHDFLVFQNAQKPMNYSPRAKINNSPFSGLSTYNNMYLNWGFGDQAPLMPQNNPTVIKDLQFYGKTNYRDCFQGLQVEPPKSTKALNSNKQYTRQLRSPLSPPNIKFNGISTAKSSYQPFRTEKNLDSKEPRLVSLSPAYQGQYNSEYFKEFDSKNRHPCPAKEVLDELSHIN